MSVRITCINKDNGDHYDPHEAITHLGWVEESTGKSDKCTRADMVDFLEKGNSAYVKDAWGNIASLVVRISRFGNKFVKTVADGRETNNLLVLLECKY
jgi:hypothetical protein